MINSAYSKSFNSSGFNPTLQKFHKMICEIIISKTMCAILLFFWQSRFINNFMEKNNYSEPENNQKLNISRTIYFKKISAQRFEDLICTNKLDRFVFFWKTFFSRTWSFFHNRKTTNLGAIFCHKKLSLYFFSRVTIWF